LVGDMDEEHEVNIGVRHAWGGLEPFGLACADRRQHVYAIGKSGTGKSTMLKNLILQDIVAGRGVGLLDPHGDLAEDILDYIPPWRTDHVVYFNPADLEYPVGLNLLQNVARERQHLVASGVVGAFKSIWRSSWGVRLEYILHAAVSALLEVGSETILGVQRMLSDEQYRNWVVKQVKDPMVRSFWVNEFDRYDDRFLQEAISPIQNKVGQLLMAAPVRNILGQVKSRFDPAFMMDNRRIMIANLSKGGLGEDNANLLGSILVTQFQLAAMARADTPENQRQDFYLYLDEFHNFSTDSFAAMLAEIRKYRLCLTLSHQHTAQLQENVRDAVFGNCGTIIAFRVGEADGAVLEREYGNGFRAEHFGDLYNYEVCVKQLKHGHQREPFWGKTVELITARRRGRENIIRRSRERYSQPRVSVEDKIRRWL
jgi:hypothetical protein